MAVLELYWDRPLPQLAEAMRLLVYFPLVCYNDGRLF